MHLMHGAVPFVVSRKPQQRQTRLLRLCLAIMLHKISKPARFNAITPEQAGTPSRVSSVSLDRATRWLYLTQINLDGCA